MPQCAEKTKKGTPCHNVVKEGQKYCPIHRRQRMKILLSSGLVLVAITFIGFLADLFGIASFFIDHLNLLPTHTPASIVVFTTLTPTQAQVNNPTTTPKGTIHTIRFVAQSISDDESVHNVYYSLDNNAEVFLIPAGSNVDCTFTRTFSRSIRVRVDIKPNKFLYEELYVDGEKIAAKSVDLNGLTYQAP